MDIDFHQILKYNTYTDKNARRIIDSLYICLELTAGSFLFPHICIGKLINKLEEEMVKSFPLLVSLCLFISLLFAGCSKKPEPTITPITPTGAGLPFEIIQRENLIPGDDIGESKSEKDVPVAYPGGTALFIIAKKEDIQQVERHISTSSKKTLYNLDFNRVFTIVLFRGSAPSTGYEVEIQEIRKVDRQINIFATFLGPTPGMLVGPMVTSPFEVVTLQKNDLQGEYQFNLIVDGKNLFQITTVLP